MDISEFTRADMGDVNPADGAFDSRSSSPVSIVSLSQSLFQDSFEYREEFGRSFSTRGDIYMFPADNIEMERFGLLPFLVLFCAFGRGLFSASLDYMHDYLHIQRGQNYTGPVREVLAHVPGQDKAVLDLGWAF
jgi:hypothetical protein